ncbi:YsnF/AvaK domain-containing protein [Roseomonas sp. E05]|uniref:YsnF/AvaK domain-containing protein n=1 Tax=Roseomonas sp. E05 TaxID=3046310 RepID=UPI0024BA534F|nr:YsnF/AvaK domain-containing protein [Roseomonas sp. E05]MDJ0390496.1 YsnF/AvaK domain-containing protein [Roseomonas sp. E05]
MTCTITGLFDTRQAAEETVRHLVERDGIDRSSVRQHGRDEVSSNTAAAGEDQGIWASLKSLFMPDEDRYSYSEGIRRGGVVVSVEVEDSQVEHTMDLFEQNGAVDLNSREAEWRQSGWAGYTGTTQETPRSTGTDTPGYDTTAGIPSSAGIAGGMGLAASGAPGLGTPESQPGSMETRSGMTGTGTDRPTASPAAMTGSDLAGSGTAATPMAEGRGGEEVIPVVEEQLRVGKRDAERGRVRVRSYVQERPVTESVTLRQEHVNVERRNVDRPMTDADDAFRERTIEATEHGEEAVVSKEARVVEEVTINKDSTQHEETVRDTVRRQDVEVEDSRSGTTPPMPRNPA